MLAIVENQQRPLTLQRVRDQLRVGRPGRSCTPSTPATALDLLFGHAREVGTATFVAQDELVITTSGDGTARPWSALTGNQIAEFPHHGKWVNAAQLSPDGRWLISASDDGMVRRFACEVCRPAAELAALAATHRRASHRQLAPGEEALYLHLPL